MTEVLEHLLAAVTAADALARSDGNSKLTGPLAYSDRLTYRLRQSTAAALRELANHPELLTVETLLRWVKELEEWEL